MSDITDQLQRTNDALLTGGNDYSDVLLDAAAEIKRLRAELDASKRRPEPPLKPLGEKDCFENLLQHGIVP